MVSCNVQRCKERNAGGGGKKKKRKALAAIENKKARVEALPETIKEARKTKHGRKILARAIIQYESKPITISGTNSKSSALSRFKQAAVAVGNGMANLIAPVNPKLFLESMAGKNSIPATKEVEQIGGDCQENSTTPRTAVTSEEAYG